MNMKTTPIRNTHVCPRQNESAGEENKHKPRGWTGTEETGKLRQRKSIITARIESGEGLFCATQDSGCRTTKFSGCRLPSVPFPEEEASRGSNSFCFYRVMWHVYPARKTAKSGAIAVHQSGSALRRRHTSCSPSTKKTKLGASTAQGSAPPENQARKNSKNTFAARPASSSTELGLSTIENLE